MSQSFLPVAAKVERKKTQQNPFTSNFSMGLGQRVSSAYHQNCTGRHHAPSPVRYPKARPHPATPTRRPIKSTVTIQPRAALPKAECEPSSPVPGPIESAVIIEEDVPFPKAKSNPGAPPNGHIDTTVTANVPTLLSEAKHHSAPSPPRPIEFAVKTQAPTPLSQALGNQPSANLAPRTIESAVNTIPSPPGLLLTIVVKTPHCPCKAHIRDLTSATSYADLLASLKKELGMPCIYFSICLLCPITEEDKFAFAIGHRVIVSDSEFKPGYRVQDGSHSLVRCEEDWREFVGDYVEEGWRTGCCRIGEGRQNRGGRVVLGLKAVCG